MMSRTRCLVLTLSAICAVLAAFYWPFLTGRQAFYQSDLTYYFEPFSVFIASSYRQGRLPLWNPFLYCGMPQVAVPSPGMFYPPVLFFVWLPFSQALAFFLSFHHLIAAAGAFLLIAELGWGLFAAALSAVAISCCGYLFALQANYTLVATVAWFPMLIYSLRRITADLRKANIFRVFFASLAMAMMVSAGRPELSVPCALIAVAYIVAVAIAACFAPARCEPAYGEAGSRELAPSELAASEAAGSAACQPASGDASKRAALSRAALQMVALFAGGMLTMPIILPALEWAKLSPRAGGLELKWVLMWSANWYDCLCMLCAQPLGDITVLGSPYLNMVASRLNAIPYVTSSYIGPIVCTFAIWSLFDRRWRWSWLILGIFLGSLLMAAGTNTPIAPFVCSLSPALAAFRYPVKLMILPVMCLVILGARGAFLSINRAVPPAAQITTATLWTLLLLVGVAFLSTPSLSKLTLQFPWNESSIDMRSMQAAQLLFGKSFIATATLGIAINALYAVFQRRIIPQFTFSLTVLSILMLSLSWPAFQYLRHATAGDFYSRVHPHTEMLRRQLVEDGHIKHRALTLFFDPLTPGETFLRDEKLGFQDGFYLYAREILLPNNNVDFGVPYSFGYEAAEVGQFKKLFSEALSVSSQNRMHDASKMDDAPMARFCQMTGTAVVLTQVYRDRKDQRVPVPEAAFFEPLRFDEKLNLRSYRVRNHVARAYFASEVAQSTWDRFFDLMSSRTSHSLLYSNYLEEPVPAELAPPANDGRGAGPASAAATASLGDSRSGRTAGDPPAAAAASGSLGDSGNIIFQTDEPDLIKLVASTNAARLLVLTDQYYPGWFAYIDDKPAKLYRVNFFARGVVVPRGSHIITFRYEPTSLYSGFACTLATLFAFLTAMIAAAVRKSPHPPAHARLSINYAPVVQLDRTPPS